ncbi:PilZ domain-containing protein [Rhodoplanes azumiensis]|uniref:PilZ domain-containing protein n=1 Tax=Rhodoplanes azumiensis TaxID=1897628 RepID=A0ABW5APT5_9BRAD
MSFFASSSSSGTVRRQRRHPRFLTLATGRIVDRDDAIDCAVVNVSVGGACLLVADAAAVPGVFELVVDPGRIRVRCVAVWRDRHHLGVAFVPVDPGASPPPPEAWLALVPTAVR